MNNVVDITASEIIEGRPFTHPKHTAIDYPILRHMARQLTIFLESELAAESPHEAKMFPEQDGGMHRILVPDMHELLRIRPLIVVGFFGQKQDTVDSNHFSPLDGILRRKIPEFKDILSYSTLAVNEDNFANLVLLRSEAVKNEWHDDPTHLEAIERSPSYYASIRIYNGEISHGLQSPDSLRLMRVKYWDYRSRPTWRGVRTLA